MEVQQKLKMGNKCFCALGNLLITSLHKISSIQLYLTIINDNSHTVWITKLDITNNRGRQTARVREENG